MTMNWYLFPNSGCHRLRRHTTVDLPVNSQATTRLLQSPEPLVTAHPQWRFLTLQSLDEACNPTVDIDTDSPDFLAMAWSHAADCFARRHALYRWPHRPMREFCSWLLHQALTAPQSLEAALDESPIGWANRIPAKFTELVPESLAECLLQLAQLRIIVWPPNHPNPMQLNVLHHGWIPAQHLPESLVPQFLAVPERWNSLHAAWHRPLQNRHPVRLVIDLNQVPPEHRAALPRAMIAPPRTNSTAWLPPEQHLADDTIEQLVAERLTPSESRS
ncbi:hypothetical protein [Tuwongella immobilis]|uniref:Uncharacterized protein n=1 Tax=Tuwongella immobilis TaxID=692036 RepID=A0A6C2YHN8_9BACT|nr:hypothetical protein [Tuwongella immobilis]VIP00653.1 unnamed protein product [Tuwongella immobilis]VTR96724.1 unnamed protein product [Tuwongella immobilis]